MDDTTAVKLIEQPETEYVHCLISNHTGYLVSDQARLAIVDEEHFGCEHLPEFIKTKDQAKQYLASLNRAYNEGAEGGQYQLRKQLQRLLNVADKGE